MEENAVPRPEPPLAALNGLEHPMDLLGKWQAEPYDGLKGRLPSWVPDQVVLDFLGDQYEVCLAVSKQRLNISQAYSCLQISIEREELSRLQDDLFQQHRDDEASELNRRLDYLTLNAPSILHDQFSRLARTLADLKLEQTECLNLWLGEAIAKNNVVGEGQRERSANAGKASGRKRRKHSQRGAILYCARRLINGGSPRLGLAAEIKCQGSFDLSERHINRILKEENIE